MFRITEDPSSGSLVHCLAKNYENDSIVSVDMDKVRCYIKYFIILILSTFYILCTNWIIKCLIVMSQFNSH